MCNLVFTAVAIPLQVAGIEPDHRRVKMAALSEGMIMLVVPCSPLDKERLSLYTVQFV
jgi:hypothetical protein